MTNGPLEQTRAPSPWEDRQLVKRELRADDDDRNGRSSRRACRAVHAGRKRPCLPLSRSAYSALSGRLPTGTGRHVGVVEQCATGLLHIRYRCDDDSGRTQVEQTLEPLLRLITGGTGSLGRRWANRPPVELTCTHRTRYRRDDRDAGPRHHAHGRVARWTGTPDRRHEALERARVFFWPLTDCGW